jgi:hypothetical protein
MNVRMRATTDRFLGVLEEYLGIIRDPSLLLCLSTGTVDTGGGLGRVSTHEAEDL